jgi:putative thioredoxin
MSERIVEATHASFAADVIGASSATPVLVDFWADWCGPCKMLAPTLERLAGDYAGRARIVKVNTDVEMDLAREHGIRSLPTLRVFRHGVAVEELIGLQPEGAIRAAIERHLERPSDRERAAAAAALAGGHSAEAVLLLRKLLHDEPDDGEARVLLVEALIGAGQLEEAAAELSALPVGLLESPRLKALEARLDLARALQDAPDLETLRLRVAQDPADLRAHHQLAAREFAAGREEAALRLWLDILRRDRNFDDGAARKSLLQAFELLEGREELLHPYRRQMMALLH